MIPVFRPSCSDLEVQYVTETLRSGWWVTGPRTAQLEKDFAVFAGTKHAVATNSCTAALQLSIEAMGIKGKEIILPALTFAATGLAVLHSGNTPVLADVNEDTLCINWQDAAGKITENTAAIIPVWYGGRVALPESPGIARLPVIEDCAHAAGSADAGMFGDIACWSFNAVKNLASGDGGMITTDDPELAARARRLRWFGISKATWERDQGTHYNWDYDIPEPGWKMDMNDITAAIAQAQLERLGEMNAARKTIVRKYLDELSGLEWMRLPQWRENASWHMFTIRIDRRDEFTSHMQSRGISTGVHYKPLNAYGIFGTADLPVTGRVWKTLVTLPLYPDMTEDETSQVISAARDFRTGEP